MFSHKSYVSVQYIRSVFLSDVLKKPAPEPSGHLSDSDPQAIITVTVHTRSTWTPGYINRSSQHTLLSKQTLGDLFQVIPCTSNEIVSNDSISTLDAEPRRPKGNDGCVICIDNLAYGDGFGEADYAQYVLLN
ncbi:hypothetical protein D9615_004583 [Tricholomella constricta]|uniref:Uncharacterized protein n=1 Tax=Tricholomella constricta TaxID=117010 RepID=A0A8H5HC63_9AGAR|nr:hypothetical protein D9615_004583 [Tricholomella constricta]